MVHLYEICLLLAWFSWLDIPPAIVLAFAGGANLESGECGQQELNAPRHLGHCIIDVIWLCCALASLAVAHVQIGALYLRGVASCARQFGRPLPTGVPTAQWSASTTTQQRLTERQALRTRYIQTANPESPPRGQRMTGTQEMVFSKQFELRKRELRIATCEFQTNPAQAKNRGEGL